MTKTPNSHQKYFYDKLRTSCDEAFVASGAEGIGRICLLGGRVSFGRARAVWTNETGGAAILTERGLRVGGSTAPIGIDYPTRLHLFDAIEDEETGWPRTRLTSFRMELDEAGLLDVHTRKLAYREPESLLSFDAAMTTLAFEGLTDPLASWQAPNTDQKVRLEMELERGASGEFRLPTPA